MNHLHAALANNGVFTVEHQAIVEAFLDIVDHVLDVVVIIVVESLLDGSKIDRLLHNFKIVWYLKPVWVNWMVEDLS